MPNLIGYTTNVAKSIVYATSNYISENMSSVKDFKETNADLFRSAYTDIINYKQTYKKILNSTDKSQVYDAGNQLMKSLKEDLRNGTFYNKKRFDEITAESFANEFGGMDDFNFDDADFNFDDTSSSSNNSKSNVAISRSIISSSQTNAGAVSNAIIKSAEYSAQVSKENTNLLYIQNTNAFNGFNKHLGVINDNIGSMLPMVDITKVTMENQKKYFEETTKLLQDQTALLREIASSVKKSDRPEQRKRSNFNDIVIGGIPDLTKYMKRIKENIENNPDIGLLGSFMNSMGDDTNILKMLAANPLGFVMEGLVGQFLVGKNLKKSMKSVDKTASTLFANLTAKLNGFADSDRDSEYNPFKDKINDVLKIFSPDTGLKKNINQGAYFKGDMNWNGLAQKALTNVIPDQLAKIISILSGLPAQIFDYESGIFKDQSRIKNDFQDLKKGYINSATGGIESEMKELSKYLNISYDEQQSLFKDMKNMLKTLYDKGVLFEYNNKNIDADYYNISDPDNYEILKGLFKNTKKNTRKQLSQNIMYNRGAQKSYFEDMEFKGNSIYNKIEQKLYDNDFSYDDKGRIIKNSSIAFKNSPLNIKSSKGYNGFWYLDQILRELRYIRSNGIFNGGGSGGGRGRRRRQTRTPNIDDYNIPYNRDNSEDIREDNENTTREEQYNSRRTELSRKYNLINPSNYSYDELQKRTDAGLKRIKNTQEEEERQRAASNDSSFFKDLMNELDETGASYARIKSITDKISSVIDKPNEIISSVFDKVDNRLYRLIYGKDEDDNPDDSRGFMDVMIEKMKLTFDNFTTWLDEDIIDPLSDKIKSWNVKDKMDMILEKTGLKDLGSNLKTYLFGDRSIGVDGLFSNVGRGIKSTFSGALDTTKQAFSNVFTHVTGGRFDSLNNQGGPNYDGMGGPTEEFFANTLKGNVTSRFGMREGNKIISKNHTGIDIGAAKGSFIKSPINGIVNDNKNTKNSNGFGNVLSVIDRMGGEHFFGHMSNRSKFKPGDTVKAGQNIGNVGSTGNSTGPHLHYETRKNGIPVNPDEYYSGMGGPTDAQKEDAIGIKRFIQEYYLKYLNNGEAPNSKLAGRMYLKIKNALNGLDPESLDYRELKKSLGGMFTSKSVMDKISDDKKQDHYNILDAVMNEVRNPSKSKNGAINFIINMGDELKNGASKIYSAYANGQNNTSEEQMKKDKEKVGNFISQASKTITDYAPETIGAALLGSGVSLMTGMVGGPLLGAAIGAGVAITKRSTKLQSMLFGEEYEDEDGNKKRKGGLLEKATSRKFIDKLTKFGPKMRDYGIVGGIAGLTPFLPFGPITGIMLGSAFGYAKESGKMQQFLFGKDNDSWLGKNKEKIKAILPRVGAGALVGSLFGPFGLIGNAAVGSAVGFATTSERFQNAIFGIPDGNGKYIGGLIPHMKEDIIDPMGAKLKKSADNTLEFFKKRLFTPLEEAMKPFAKQLEVAGKSLGKGILNIFDRVIESTFGVPMTKLVAQIAKPITNAVFKVTSGMVKGAFGIPSALFGATIGRMGTSLKKRQIKKGNADYMSAKERLEYRNKHLMGFGDQFSEFDQVLDEAGQGNIENLTKMRDNLSNMRSDYKNNKSERMKRLDVMGTMVSRDLGFFTSRNIMKLISEGKSDEAMELLNNSKLDDGKKDLLKRRLNNRIDDYKGFLQNQNKNSEGYKNLIEQLKASGVKIPKEMLKNPENLNKYISLIDKEIKVHKNKEDGKTPEERIEELQEEEAERTKTFREKLNKTIETIASLLQDIAHPSPDKDSAIDALKGKKVIKRYTRNTDGRLFRYDENGNKIFIDGNGEENNNPQNQNNNPELEQSAAGAGKPRTQRDNKGREYHIDGNGNIIYNRGDTETREAMDEENRDKSFKSKITDYISGKFGKVKDKVTGLRDRLEEKASQGKSLVTKMMGYGMMLAFAPMALQFIKNTVYPWFKDKVVPFITGTVAPAIGNIIGSIVKTTLKDVGGWLLKKMSTVLKEAFNSTIGKVFPFLKMKTTDDSDKTVTNQSMDRNGNTVTTYSDGSTQTTDPTGNVISTTESTKNQHTDLGNVGTSALRYVVTGGKTGAGLKMVGKTVGLAGRLAGHGVNVLGAAKNFITHPIKSILHPIDAITKKNFVGETLKKSGGIFDKVKGRMDKMADGANTIYKKIGDVNSTAIDSALNTVKSFLYKIISNPVVERLIGGDKCAKILEKFVPDFLVKLGKGLTKNIAKIGTRLAGLSTGGLLNAVFAVTDFIYGFNHAQEILKINEEPTLVEKIGCALIKSLSGLTIVLSVLPDSFFIDLIFDTLLPIFGVTDTTFQQQRKNAQAQLDDYNKKNKTDLSMEEYIKTQKDNANKNTPWKDKSFFQKVQSIFSGDPIQRYKDITGKDQVDQQTQKFYDDANKKSKLGVIDNIKDNMNQLGSQIKGLWNKGVSWFNGSGGSNDFEKSNNQYSNIINKKYYGMGGSNEDFLSQVVPGAQETYKEYGILPSITIAQAINESGWGKSYAAKTDKNLFGIKFPGNHDPSLQIQQGSGATDDGGNYTMYNSWADSLKDHGYFLKHNDIYAKAGVFDAKTPQEQIEAIKKAGYASDPNYVSTTMQIVNDNNLTQYDNGVSYTGTSSSSNSDTSDSGNTGLAGFFTGLAGAVTDSINKVYGFNTSSNGNSSNNTSGGNVTGQAGNVINIAKSFLGSPYVYGGTTAPKKSSTGDWSGGGFDCSGFVQYIYKQIGIDIPRTTYEQIGVGTAIDDTNQLQPGDLVFFGTQSSPHHVGMYIGNGQFIHAPKTGDVVKISNLSDMRDFCGGRRILGTSNAVGGAKFTGIGGPNMKFKGVGGIGDFLARSLKGNVTSGFGFRNTNGNIPKNHTGIDIGAQEGTNIKSPISGIVTRSQTTKDSNGFGNLLVLKDGMGGEHFFGHMNSKSNLKPGDTVKAGENIGNVGSTGNSTGPHLHYETRKNGIPVNPDEYIRNSFQQAQKGIGGADDNSYTIDNNDRAPIGYNTNKADMDKFLQSVVNLLTKIALNTDTLNKIVELLSTNGTSSSDTSNNNLSNKKQQILNKIQSATSNNQDISLSELTKQMEMLASGF